MSISKDQEEDVRESKTNLHLNERSAIISMYFKMDERQVAQRIDANNINSLLCSRLEKWKKLNPISYSNDVTNVSSEPVPDFYRF